MYLEFLEDLLENEFLIIEKEGQQYRFDVEQIRLIDSFGLNLDELGISKWDWLSLEYDQQQDLYFTDTFTAWLEYYPN